MWLNVLVLGMLVLVDCFEIWLWLGYGDVLEPPLSVKSSQPHLRSFLGGGEL